jgi:hypothetical protein
MLVAACGAGQPAHGPKYTPVDSPEPPTDCPTENEAAKNARANAIGADDMGAAEVAAEKVFALAECERKVFDAEQLSAADPDELRDLRDKFQSIANLYEEVTNYQTPKWAVAGLVRDGELSQAYAKKLRAIPARPGTEEAVDAEEVAKLSTVIDEEGRALLTKALDASETLWQTTPDDADLRGWLATACAGVRRPGASLATTTYRACH